MAARKRQSGVGADPSGFAVTSRQSVTYLYQGQCPLTGQRLTLPRTAEMEEKARRWMAEMPWPEEGRMWGLLEVEGGELLRAYSGQAAAPPGSWAPSLEPPGGTPLEQQTLQRLEFLKGQLGRLDRARQALELGKHESHWESAYRDLLARQGERKAQRDRRREQGECPQQLARESQGDSRERRIFSQQRRQQLEPLRQSVRALEAQMQDCRRERRCLSQRLQQELHQSFSADLFAGKPWSLASLFPRGAPTGVGQCCAPKLLHWASVRQLTPTALAEFWWGPPPAGGGRVSGQFYEACRERCQPLLGPLLAGFGARLTLVYEDSDLLVVDKPPGVLTVPGRVGWKQDSLQTRLQARYPEILAVHRLDLETSGLVVWARHGEAQRRLQRAFAAGRVSKTYQALLHHRPDRDQGRIEAALGPDPLHPGRSVLMQGGREAVTDFRLLGHHPVRVELRPHQGRSHQLRVHMAHFLESPILGDPLYGEGGPRLMLHAWRLSLEHPFTGQTLEWESPLPF